MLADTLNGQPVRGCHNLVGHPWDTSSPPQRAVIDWMCEGTGLLCRDCAAEHLSDPATPHRDRRHETCIVCGLVSDTNLHALAAHVELRKPLMLTSDPIDMLSDLIKQKIAYGFVGDLVTTPVC